MDLFKIESRLSIKVTCKCRQSNFDGLKFDFFFVTFQWYKTDILSVDTVL
jgi:hypothetical protein